LKLNGTHQLLIYADDVNILGGSIHTVKKNVVAITKVGLEVYADETNYMVMSQDQNAGLGCGTNTDNSSSERVEQFTYLGTTVLTYSLTYLLTHSLTYLLLTHSLTHSFIHLLTH